MHALKIITNSTTECCCTTRQYFTRILNQSSLDPQELQELIQLSKPQLNHNSTQPNITKVGFDMKMTVHLHLTPPSPAPPPTESQCQQ